VLNKLGAAQLLKFTRKQENRILARYLIIVGIY